MNFLRDYLSVQFDPAHLLSELGFELFQFVIIYRVWKMKIKPRMARKMHAEFDAEHNIPPHNQDGKSFKYEVGEMVNVYSVQGFTRLTVSTVMERKIGLFGRPRYRVRMGRNQRWQGQRGMFLIDNTRHYHIDVYKGDKRLQRRVDDPQSTEITTRSTK